MASHNDLREHPHIPDFPDQTAITAFLRGLLGNGRTQVSWAADAGIPYNSFTNWFTTKPTAMSAEALLRVVKAAGAENALADWLRNFQAVPRAAADPSSRQSEGANGVIPESPRDVPRQKAPEVFVAEPEGASKPIRRSAAGGKRAPRKRRTG